MSKLGLAAIAGNAAFENDRRLEDRAFQEKQRAYQQQVMDASASGLADRTAAQTAADKLAAARSTSGLSMLPGETANAIERQGLEAGNIKYQKEQQPTVQANQTKAMTVQGAGLDSAIAQVGENEKARVAGNANADVQRRQQAFVNFAGMLDSADKGSALSYLNSYAESDPLLKGKKFTNIEARGAVGKDGAGMQQDGRVFALIAEDGTSVDIPYQSIVKAREQAKTGKYKFIKNENGQVVAGNELTGSAKEVIPADPRLATLGANGKPSEMQMQYQFLTQHPDGPQLTKEKATEMITKGSHKTAEERYHAYKTELVKAAASWNKPINMDEINKQASALAGFDPNKTPGLPSASNTPNPVKVNPKYESLFNH